MTYHNKWEEIRIDSWEEFDTKIAKLPYRQWLYRGQNDAKWEIKTSLYRLFEDASETIKLSKNSQRKFAKDVHEELLIKKFITNAHLYLHTTPKLKDKLEWLSLMQHFGAPTRMLDVTLSPHIATYFALESGHGDAAIFAFNYSRIKELDESSLGLTNAKDEVFKNRKGSKSFIVAHESNFANERLLCQQGLFLVPSTNYHTFDELLDTYGDKGKVCKKFVIPARIRLEGIERLREMNITSSSLFPGIDGFCKSLKHQVYESTRLQRLFD
ncbi:FRG domain-containing protein [Photobacterium leiognathi]|uniref:FRG domain-containing protein n=1 Tax=Photobacterium leiognathi TaxID=553611 RepID=UPI002980D04C|nr:FRG domain-containing protein [Photobacterium leiognathi]